MKRLIVCAFLLISFLSVGALYALQPRRVQDSSVGTAARSGERIPAGHTANDAYGRELKDAEHALVMLTANGKGAIEGEFWIPVHFKARHKAQVAGPYQFVARAHVFGRPQVVAEQKFDKYMLAAQEEREDEFAVALKVPPGKYIVEVELLSLYPVVDQQGNKLADHLGQGNHLYVASVKGD